MGYSLFLLSSKDSVSCDDSDDDDEGLSWIQLNFTSLVPRKNNVNVRKLEAQTAAQRLLTKLLQSTFVRDVSKIPNR